MTVIRVMNRRLAFTGHHVTVWAPGDGHRRYRLGPKPLDYDGMRGSMTVTGLKNLEMMVTTFIEGFLAGEAHAERREDQ